MLGLGLGLGLAFVLLPVVDTHPVLQGPQISASQDQEGAIMLRCSRERGKWGGHSGALRTLMTIPFSKNPNTKLEHLLEEQDRCWHRRLPSVVDFG